MKISRDIVEAGCIMTATRYVANHRQDKAQDAWAYLASIERMTKGRSTEALFKQLHSTQTFLEKSFVIYHTMT